MVVGPNSSEWNNYIQNKRLSKNVEITYLGIVENHLIQEFMHGSDIFCTPSIREGLGVANIEALATGIPVVTSNAGGIVEVLDNGNNGWICEKNNIDSLALALSHCIANPSATKMKCLRGRSFVEVNFNHRNMLNQFYNIIKLEVE